RRLAGAVRAEKGEDLAGVHGEGNVVDRGQLAVALDEVIDADDGARRSGRHAPRTSNPKARAAAPSAVSCVSITGVVSMRSRQISAVARCRASNVPSGVGIG